MAISAGSALISTVGAGVTLSGGTIAFSAAALIGKSFVTHFLVSTAIGAAINALTPKPGTPGAAGYTVTAKGSNLDHQIIYGQTRVAGAVVADFLSGEGGAEGTRFLHRVQVMAGHEIESYEEIYVNSYKVTEWKANTAAGAGAVTGITDLTPWLNDPFAVLVPTKLVEVDPDGTETVVEDYDFDEYNALAMQFWTGADDQTASTKLIASIPNSKWTSDHRLRGRAYMYIRMGRDVDGDNFPTGVPEITAVIKGRKVYDPREVSHDPGDKSTWEWSSNPALCTRDYLTQDFGLGEKDIQVDDDLVTDAADVCDQTADDGSTRYTCNGAFTTGIQPYDFLNSILTSMGGLLWYAQGQWRMKPAYWTAPVESFNEDDFRSTISVSTRHSRKDNFNTVEGTFRGPKSNYSLTTFPAVDSAASIAADGGTVSKIDLEMPFTDTPEEARRIARIVLERNRQQITVRASFGLKAFRVQVGDTINLSFERFGWVNKTFEVTEWTFGNVDQYDIQIDLTLREITENVFDEVDDGAVFELDNADVPSPLAGLTVANLTATSSGFTSTDGTFVPNILVDWDSVLNSNVAEYIVEWGRAAFSFAEYGGEVTDTGSFTTREQFIFDAYNDILLRNPDQSGFDFYNTGGGSGLTETQIRLQLQNSPEKRAISGSVRVGGETTEYTISPAADDSMYSIRVKAINDFGTSSKWATVTVNVGVDDTVPDAPTGLSAVGSFGFINLSWVNPPDVDFNFVEVWESTDNNLSNASQISVVPGNDFKRGNLSPFTTRYYWVRAVDYSGNKSSFAGPSVATTEQITAGDIGNAVIDYDNFASDVVNLFNSIQSDIGQVSDDTVALESDVSTLQSQFTTLDGEVSTNSTAVSGLETRVTSNEGSISTNASQITSLESSLTTLDGEVSGNATAISGLDTRVTDNEGDITAQASQISSLSTTVDGNTTTVTQVSESVDGIEGRYGVEIDNNGNITGYQLLSGVGGSAFNVRADQFAVFDSNNNGGDNPFTILTTSTTIDGVTYPAGTYVQNTLFAEAISVGTTSQGLFVNSLGKEDAVYVYQDSDLIYGLFVENFYNPGFSEGAGGAALFKSFGGFTVEINNTENNQSTDDAAVFAQNSDSRLSVGGAVWLGESGLDGGYGVNVLRGGYYDTSGEGYLPFTGSHEAMVLKTEVLSQGDIVCDHAVVAKSISDSFTEVVRSTKPNMPSAIGVYKGPRSSGWVGIAAFVDKDTTSENSLAPATNSEGEKVHRGRIKAYNLDWTVYEDDYTPIFVNSVGEGAINVCGEAGNISKGDLIVTSNMAGKGMRQSDDIVRSYTVAKAREDVTFSSPTEVKMIACIYLCG